MCESVNNTFDCSCLRGYEGDGFTCLGKKIFCIFILFMTYSPSHMQKLIIVRIIIAVPMLTVEMLASHSSVLVNLGMKVMATLAYVCFVIITL